MIDHLDNLLLQLFRNEIAEITADQQVRFQPPDDDWRGLVPGITDGAGNPANSLNVYLVELRENRLLRTNGRERWTSGQDVFETPPPRRVDCYYLISAWSPIAVTSAIDPTLDEHALLSEAARVLGAHDELDPVAIYAAGAPPQAPPPAIADLTFPLTLLPTEGFPKYAEFWGTMGGKARWKPCVYALLTVPLAEAPVRAGPIVTTTLTTVRSADDSTMAETLFHIGGTVMDGGMPAQPVPLAWVERLSPANVREALVRADAQGRFVFADVAAGAWRLRASAAPPLGVAPVRDVVVPEPTGSYDLSF